MYETISIKTWYNLALNFHTIISDKNTKFSLFYPKRPLICLWYCKILFEKYNGKMPTYEQYLKLELKKIKDQKNKIKIEKIKPNIVS